MSDRNRGDAEKGWTVSVSIDERDGQTRAKARLRWRDNEAVGVGLARLSPAERYVTGIGDELAVARALSDLARRMKLRDAAADDRVHRRGIALRAFQAVERRSGRQAVGVLVAD